jgi:adenylate cyclase
VNGDQTKAGALTVRVSLLGPFSVSVAGRSTDGWPRPSARRLCELVLVSPGRRVSRDVVCEELFPDLDPRAAARSVSRALSMARAALSPLGGQAAALLEADLVHIWASPSAEVDAEIHETALRTALSAGPGRERDALLVEALAETRELLADEPYADWAVRPRERLEALRLQARLTLARDRSKGAGRSDPDAVLAAWETCFEHDPANEEAAGALVRAYFAAGRRQLAARVYERCSAALRELGLRISPSLDEVYAAASFEEPAADLVRPEPEPPKSELRTVTVLFAEVAAQLGLAGKLGLEAVREIVSGSLAAVITEVEAFGGTVTSVSGGGLQAVFGAPQAHEDDPERALRAAFRALAWVKTTSQAPVLRIGVETGPALLGPIGAGGKVEYGAVGDVVGLAAAFQSSAAPGSVLVGPVTRAATSHLFTWGATERIPPSPGTAPVTGTYLGQPKPAASARRLGLGGRGPLVGREAELALLSTALREAVNGHGSVVLLTGEPGLGKTRLVQDCRKRFMAEAGSTHGATRGATRGGSLPLWVEGRCASYASATPYGLYQQVLASWLGVAPDQPDAVRPALERALQTTVGSTELFPPLARMMGLASGAALGRMSPEDLQRATFAALREVIARLVARGPTVLVLEDLHWADPTSLRLTGELAGLAAGRRLLVLITSRPGADVDLPASAGLRRIELTPLPADAERELARSLVGENASREVLDTVLANVDGNPLFLEERLSSLIETGSLVRAAGAAGDAHDAGGWRVREAALPGPEVPQVLERLVRSRVDRLSPPAREAIRVASVLGVEFPLSLLAAVLGGANRDAVGELVAKDLLHEISGAPEPTFRFRHALIQEATYEGLLRAERRQLHGRAAWALEALLRSPLEDGASVPSQRSAPPHSNDAVLGRHFAAAGETERALWYLEHAGDHATGAFANDEAISSYRAALEIADEQQASDAAAAVSLRAKLANVLWRTGRRAEAREAFEDALRLADETDIVRKAHLLTRLGRLELAEQRYEAAAEAFDRAAGLLGDDPAAMAHKDDATVDQWLEMMVDGRADLYAVRREPERPW